MSALNFIRRRVLNKTMDELAQELNVSKQAVYTWESGRKSIPEARIKQLSELTGIPEKYFLQNPSPEEKIEMIRYNSFKKIWDRDLSVGTEVTFGGEYVDLNEIDHTQLADVEIQTGNTLRKIKLAIRRHRSRSGAIRERMTGDVLEEMRERGMLFDRFADLVEVSERKEPLDQILRAVELFFEMSACNEECGREPQGLPSDMLEKESLLTQALYKVLYEHRAEQ